MSSLRTSPEQKLKEEDKILCEIECTNKADVIFFSDKYNVYKMKLKDIADSKASVFGDYLPNILSMEENERILFCLATTEYSGYVFFAFENGKVAKVPLKSYETKTKRKKLSNAYSGKSPLAALFESTDQEEFVLTSTAQRKLLFHSAAILPKTTRDTQGVAVMTLKKNHFVEKVERFVEGMFANPHRFRSKTLPSAGALMREEDYGEQLNLLGE